MFVRGRLNVTSYVFCLSCFTEWVVSNGNTSHIFWRFRIRISAEAPDMLFVIETFIALPLIFRASPVRGELSRYFFSGVLRSISPNFCREYTGELSWQFSGNWRRIFSIFILGCLTENYFDILSDSSLWIFSNLVGYIMVNFLDFSRLHYGEFSRL